MTRPRLVDRLSRNNDARLTLVSAPAGFGKTTLLAAWLTSAPRPEGLTAWLSLDQSDNDPTAFWTYVIAALQTVAPAVGTRPLALIEAGQPPIEVVLGALLNQLNAFSKDLVLVLDDYHVIDHGQIHDGMAFFVDRLPPHVHLVMASRADPPLPLARLRARGELVEIRAADLRFTSDEAASYFNEVMALELAPGDLAMLEGRTEGWIAALQLAALSMQGRDTVAEFVKGFAGDDRYIVDYLVEEVLQRQPEHVRRFLLQTSVLNRLTGPLCDAVTEQDGGKGTLEALDRANLFLVALDDRRQRYRYHHLFADVLRAGRTRRKRTVAVAHADERSQLVRQIWARTGRHRPCGPLRLFGLGCRTSSAGLVCFWCAQGSVSGSRSTGAPATPACPQLPGCGRWTTTWLGSD